MKYATIGTSWITEAFIAGAKLKDHMRLGAVYSRDLDKARAFGTKHGCDPVFDDMEKLAAWDGIDAVYIASPNSLHYSQSKLFLQNGKHVLCEKPIAVTPGEYEELTGLANQKSLVYLEALMMMHHPERDKLKETLKKIGRITTARLDFSQLSSKYGSLTEGETPNVFNPALAGGCLMDMGIYCVYPALHWFGMPDEIYAGAGWLHTGADGYVNSVFNYPDKQVSISLSKVGQSFIGCEILGDTGTVTVGFIVEMRDIWLHKKDGYKEQVIPNYSRTELMGFEAEAFYRYAREYNKYEKEYRQKQGESLAALRALEQIRKKAGILLPYNK